MVTYHYVKFYVSIIIYLEVISHNTAQIQHCPISTTFHMWVDYDVPKWFLTSKNFYRLHDIRQCWIFAVLWRPFWKWRPVEIFQCRDIIIYSHIKFWWYRTMLNFYHPFLIPYFGTPFHMWVDYDVPKWFLTSKNFYRLQTCLLLRFCRIYYTFLQ
jgi:hypothetical protein